MTLPIIKKIAVVSVGLFLTGCATQAEIDAFSDPTRGFTEVQDKTRATINKDSVWVQSHQEAGTTASRVHQLIHKKTIDAETAVQAALLSNKGLQAAYADIGMSAADVWQEALACKSQADCDVQPDRHRTHRRIPDHGKYCPRHVLQGQD